MAVWAAGWTYLIDGFGDTQGIAQIPWYAVYRTRVVGSVLTDPRTRRSIAVRSEYRHDLIPAHHDSPIDDCRIYGDYIL